MFNNLVNAGDVLTIATKLRRGQLPGAVRRFARLPEARVKSSWAHVTGEPTHWFDVPAVREREAMRASGDPSVSPVEWFSGEYLRGREGLVALSLGCGSGSKELSWARLAKFERIDGYDLSGPRIRSANERAEEAGFGDVLNFQEGDVYRCDLPRAHYDLVIFEDALHHFSPLDELLVRVRESLKPGGYVFLNEFVGPRRFQWPDRQVELADHLLGLLPPTYRRERESGAVKTAVARPSRLRMILRDPSESVESDQIMPAVARLFDVLEVRPLGGTLVHLVLQEIAHHFKPGDETSRSLLAFMFDVEDALLAVGEIASDHVLAVCRRAAS